MAGCRALVSGVRAQGGRYQLWPKRSLAIVFGQTIFGQYHLWPIPSLANTIFDQYHL